MREQKRRFEADLKLLDLQQARERQEMDQIARDLAQASVSGPVSEPTTPPEYRDTGFPTSLSRPSRFSTSSATTPGIFNMFGSPSQIASPPKSAVATTPKQESAPQSVIGSRRNSEENHSADAYPTFRPGLSYVLSLFVLFIYLFLFRWVYLLFVYVLCKKKLPKHSCEVLSTYKTTPKHPITKPICFLSLLHVTIFFKYLSLY